MILFNKIKSFYTLPAFFIIFIIFSPIETSAKSSPNFSLEAWLSIQDTYKKLVHHPFNLELSSGRLPRDKFYFYEEQDAYYLKVYSLVLHTIAKRTSNMTHKKVFNRLAIECAKETTLTTSFKLNRYTPSTLAYTSFLLAVSTYKSPEEIAAPGFDSSTMRIQS